MIPEDARINNARAKTLSHVGDDGKPAMADVGGKAVTRRLARARAVVVVGEEVLSALLREDGSLRSAKGAVFETAALAGIMAAKKTGELIPLCHPLGLDHCDVSIALNERGDVVIECEAKLEAKTGVEMEALVGAAVAALTVYDMCKAISHNIVIQEVRLVEKRGGKSDFAFNAPNDNP